MAKSATASARRALARVAVARHDHDLDALGLDGGRAIPSDGRIARERRLVRSELVALAPGAAVGAVTNAPVALAIRGVAAAVREPSWQATAKGVAGLGLCPIVWGAEAFLVRRHGRRAVLGVLAVAPLGGMAWIVLAGTPPAVASGAAARSTCSRPGRTDDPRRGGEPGRGAGRGRRSWCGTRAPDRAELAD